MAAQQGLSHVPGLPFDFTNRHVRLNPLTSWSITRQRANAWSQNCRRSRRISKCNGHN